MVDVARVAVENEGLDDLGGATPTLAEQGLEAANRGHDRLSAFWAELTQGERESVGGLDTLLGWKFIAARARPFQ